MNDELPTGGEVFRGKPLPLRKRIKHRCAGLGFLLLATVMCAIIFSPGGALELLGGRGEGQQTVGQVIVDTMWGVALLIIWTLLALGGLAVMAASLHGAHWMRRVRFHVSAEGCEVRHGHKRIPLPWADIERWHTDSSLRQGELSRNVTGIVAIPAAHVHDPAAPPREAIWVPRAGHWVLCEPQFMHASMAEVEAAMRRYAESKRDPYPGRRVR